MGKIFLKKRWLLAITGAVVVALCMSMYRPASAVAETQPSKAPSFNYNDRLYDSLGWSAIGLSRNAFIYAANGFDKLRNAGRLTNRDLLTIIDFSQPSNKKRLFVVNMTTGRLVLNTYVSHGKNSGMLTATAFSNEHNSFKSSLGFYITGNTYKGQHGRSLRLLGEEKGFNDNALARGIVIHSANYVSDAFVGRQGRLGRSEGCPAIPAKMREKVIRAIQDGSCLFIYAPDANYVANSQLIKSAALSIGGTVG